MTTRKHAVQTEVDKWGHSREMSPRKWVWRKAGCRILMHLGFHKIFTIWIENVVKISDDDIQMKQRKKAIIAGKEQKSRNALDMY